MKTYHASGVVVGHTWGGGVEGFNASEFFGSKFSSFSAQNTEPTEKQIAMIFGLSREVMPYMTKEEGEELQVFLNLVNEKKKHKSLVSMKITELMERKEIINQSLEAGTLKKITVITSDYGLSTAEAKMLLTKAESVLDDTEYAKLSEDTASCYTSFLAYIAREEEDERDVESITGIKTYWSIDQFDQLLKDINWKAYKTEAHMMRMSASKMYKIFLKLRRMVEVAEDRVLSNNPEMLSYFSLPEEREFFYEELEGERADVPRYVEDYGDSGLVEPSFYKEYKAIIKMMMESKEEEQERARGEEIVQLFQELEEKTKMTIKEIKEVIDFYDSEKEYLSEPVFWNAVPEVAKDAGKIESTKTRNRKEYLKAQALDRAQILFEYQS